MRKSTKVASNKKENSSPAIAAAPGVRKPALVKVSFVATFASRAVEE
jgi:hypothetical protein